MIHQNTESLKELSNRYQILLQKRESLISNIDSIKDKEALKLKKDELNNIEMQIQKLNSLILTIFIQIQKLIDDMQQKDANRLY